MKIFCLESDWDNDLKSRKSVAPFMEYMQAVLGRSNFDYILRQVPTSESLNFYLTKLSQKKYAKFDVVYLAMHGSGGKIHLANQEVLSLDDLAAKFPALFYSKLVHFGSCSTLNVDSNTIKNFKKVTGAKFISGYTTDVDFVESSMLEMGYLSWIPEYINRGSLKKRIQDDYPELVMRLGFVFF